MKKPKKERKAPMQFIAQIQKAEKADLTMDWQPVNGSDYADAALMFLKNGLVTGDDVLTPQGFAWVAVADADGPKYDNGMPMVFHAFKLEWEKPLPS